MCFVVCALVKCVFFQVKTFYTLFDRSIQNVPMKAHEYIDPFSRENYSLYRYFVLSKNK